MTSFESVVADLDYMVRELQRERKQVSSVKRELAQIETRIHQQFPELAEARIRLKIAQAEADQLDGQLRLDALEQWERGDGGKNEIHPAIKIKEYTVLDYEQDAAIDYCREHLPNALKLDKRPFEAVAKVAELDFVTISKEARATIATDLLKYLDGQEDV